MSAPLATSLALTEHCATLADPRVERTTRHPLGSIVVIAWCAVIGGAESWDELAAFGEAKPAWLQPFLDLPNGIPSHDSCKRVFATLDPQRFPRCFVAWMPAVAEVPPQVIASAGKTVRGSHDRANGKAAIHLVSAWASANRLVLAQVTVDATSTELTAIPELLRVLALEGCLVTIDALGCQREIARQSSEQWGAYVLARKGNQETRYHDVVALVADAQAKTSAEVVVDEHRRVDKGHGWIEVRHWRVSGDPDVLA